MRVTRSLLRPSGSLVVLGVNVVRQLLKIGVRVAVLGPVSCAASTLHDRWLVHN